MSEFQNDQKLDAQKSRDIRTGNVKKVLAPISRPTTFDTEQKLQRPQGIKSAHIVKRTLTPIPKPIAPEAQQNKPLKLDEEEKQLDAHILEARLRAENLQGKDVNEFPLRDKIHILTTRGRKQVQQMQKEGTLSPDNLSSGKRVGFNESAEFYDWQTNKITHESLGELDKKHEIQKEDERIKKALEKQQKSKEIDHSILSPLEESSKLPKIIRDTEKEKRIMSALGEFNNWKVENKVNDLTSNQSSFLPPLGSDKLANIGNLKKPSGGRGR